MAVLPFTSSSKCLYISYSAMGSRAAVGSSSMTTGASLMRALAMASFCCSPPEGSIPSWSNCLNRTVSIPFLKESTFSSIPIFRKVSLARASSVSGFISSESFNSRFSLIRNAKSLKSWNTGANTFMYS